MSASIPLQQPATKWVPPVVNIDNVRGCTLKFKWQEAHGSINPYSGGCETYLNQPVYYPYGSFAPSKVHVISNICKEEIRNIQGLWAMQTTSIQTVFECEVNLVIESFRSQAYLDQVLSYIYFYYIPSSFVSYDWYLTPNSDNGLPVVNQRIVSEPNIITFGCDRAGSIYPPLVPIKYLGIAAPPPPKNMDCCTCNDIATIVEAKNYDQLLALQKLFEELKDHIDKRSLEIILKDLEHLRALDFEEFLKAVIKRINEVESNLWNGVKQ